MAPVSQAPRRYFVELNAAMLLFLVALFGRAYVVHLVGNPALKAVILLSPILPIILVALAIYRFYRRMDEYHRLRLLEQLALSAGITAVVTISWDFLQDVGAPRLSIIFTWPIMGTCWLIVAAVFGWRDSASEGKLGTALRRLGVTVLLMAAVTAIYAFVAGATGLPHSVGLLMLVATAVFLTRVGYFIFSKKSASC